MSAPVCSAIVCTANNPLPRAYDIAPLIRDLRPAIWPPLAELKIALVFS